MAFQLTNFLRDVGEDLDRGRVYLPADELAAFGVDRELLAWSRRTRRPDPRISRALAHLVAHTRAVYRRAAPGIAMLEPVSRACVACAFGLYGGILAEIERAGYAVLHQRVAVPPRAPGRGGHPRLWRRDRPGVALAERAQVLHQRGRPVRAELQAQHADVHRQHLEAVGPGDQHRRASSSTDSTTPTVGLIRASTSAAGASTVIRACTVQPVAATSRSTNAV